MRKILLILLAAAALLASGAEVADLSRDGIDIKVTAEPAVVDVARDFFVTLTFTSPAGTKLVLPDLRYRFTGFHQVDEQNYYADDPVTDASGRTSYVSHWRLTPEPVSAKYRLAPFVVTCLSTNQLPTTSQPTTTAFCTAPVYFTPPAPRPAVTGEMELNPTKDLPPLSWKLVGLCALALGVLALLVWAIVWIVKKIRESIRVHRMSPIERAYYELDKLIQKGLPGKGFYKDFYVELTMVVRRYVERQHGVRAPNLTTEEFFEATRTADTFPKSTLDLLIDFLRKADMVKFAGVTATAETADAATKSARSYIAKDDEIVKRRARQKGSVANIEAIRRQLSGEHN